MLTIRKQQNDALSQYMLRQFENNMILYLRSQFPTECGDKAEAELRDMVRSAIKNAEPYGIESEDGIQCYLGCMAKCGEDFDTNPRTPWAGAILRDAGLGEVEKAQLLGRNAGIPLPEGA